ncbi:hypothetical protein [Nissabacter sp. SGAir0207]|uniref:hypothetical protein n=1 Tax=Nissabacter sp. SGAir0207 TaxID=2126321 RepID=UPI001F0DEF12|nr:hypothetical protein [Nissabacter sp. SGAir0207]
MNLNNTPKNVPKLPPKLQRHLSELKSYVDRQVDGVSLAMVQRKVSVLQTMTSKELEFLVQFVHVRERIHVYTIYPVGRPGSAIYLRHSRHGEPMAPMGHTLTPPEERQPTQAPHYVPGDLKDIAANLKWGAAPEPAMPIVEKETIKEMPIQESKTSLPTEPVLKALKHTPAELRRQAEEMLRQAEMQERETQEKDMFQKRLGPIKTDLLRAAHKLRNAADELIDAMAEMEQATDRLKNLTA